MHIRNLCPVLASQTIGARTNAHQTNAHQTNAHQTNAYRRNAHRTIAHRENAVLGQMLTVKFHVFRRGLHHHPGVRITIDCLRMDQALCHKLPHRCSPYVQSTCDNVTSQSSRVGQVLQIEV